MVLPSQVAQSTSHRKYMYRSRRMRRGPLVAAVVVLGVAATAWATYRLWPTGESDATPAGEAKATPVVAAPPPRTEAAKPAARKPEVATKAPPKDAPPKTTPPVTMGALATDAGTRQQPGIKEPNPATAPPSGPSQPSPVPHEPSKPTAPATTLAGRPPETAAPPPRVRPPGAQPEPKTERSAERAAADGERESAGSPSIQQRAAAGQQLAQGLGFVASEKPLEARRALTAALAVEGALSAADQQRARQALAKINERLVWGPSIVSGDPFSTQYVVQEGDRLTSIVRQKDLDVDWRLIQRINQIPRPEDLRLGQRLKLLRGPFHAVVHKSSFRIDLFLGDGPDRVLAASFPVGLGEFDSTPPGMYRVRTGSKLVNPQWTNPRTGQHFGADDPDNPIGERWIGLEGTDERTRDLKGYGIHGTIEPQSIGSQKSMGCVRMLPHDVEVVYEVLMEDASTIQIAAQ